MALRIAGAAPTLCIRREAYEQSGIVRSAVDALLGLTSEEFRVEGQLVAVGPLYDVPLDGLFGALEAAGLKYFDDYFELSGNWPDWLQILAASG
jgi:hypothetical protein